MTTTITPPPVVSDPVNVEPLPAQSLVSVQRVRDYLGTVATDCDEGTLSRFVLAASNLVETYCNRVFGVRTWDEIYTSSCQTDLMLRQHPVISVERVTLGPVPVIYLYNKQVDLSTVAVDDIGITLNSLSKGSTTSDRLDYVDFPTVTDLVAGIQAVKPWISWPAPLFEGWPSSEIAKYGGVFGTRWAPTWLKVFGRWLYDYRINYRIGEISGYFPSGYQNVRVIYTAGLDCLPPDVEQAICEIVQGMFAQKNMNPLLRAETIGAYKYERNVMPGGGLLEMLSPSSRYALSLWKTRWAERV